jgi:hypothetical protein
VPPGFANITYKVFIIFGVLCFAAAVQAYFTYPETCGKTLEEIEILFSKDGPHPWHTKPGGSRLDAEIQAVIERKQQGVAHGEHGAELADDEEKNVQSGVHEEKVPVAAV